MSHTTVTTPMSRCRLGTGSCDITPPVGIYHRFWGAARHDQATGVHRPLRASVVLLAPAEQADASPAALIAIDHCLLRHAEMNTLREEVARLTGADAEKLTFTFSHTHSGGNISLDRVELPGGDLIPPYLAELPVRIAAAWQAARDSMDEVMVLWAEADCRMGHERDLLDESTGGYVCGFNPAVELALPVQVGAVRNLDGSPRATLVNYPCHPTTLAWDNTEISPDYIGAMRETVESATDCPCVFLLAPCGDIGPRFGFTGDHEQADRNGRQLAWAALSARESLPENAVDYHYAGPRISGATIGEWVFETPGDDRLQALAAFEESSWTVELPWQDGLPTAAEAREQLASYEQREAECRAAGDTAGAADQRALAERQRRLLGRLGELPEGDTFPYLIRMWTLGDVRVIAVGGEPYYYLQQTARERLPEQKLVFVTLADGAQAGYLPSRAAWDRPGLYQTSIAVLGRESLDLVVNSIVTRLSGDSQ